ncbi:unnamed protein product [Lymnaea stagnalis]|uniref:Uncharacterized protein n=1 Tax=Lymnaea stagnalis TaxID=6523 RepID=A0AAV2HG90_LYMST
MKSMACIIVTLWLFTTTSVLEISAASDGYNYSQVLSTFCHSSSIKHTITATGQLKTTVVSFVQGQADLDTTEPETKEMICNVWTVTSEINQSELTVIINSLILAPKDLFFIASDTRDEVVSYDYNMTNQHDLFPKEVTSRRPIVLTWVRPVVQDYDMEPRKQRLAFSCLAVGGTDPSLEEKERVVLMGAIVISFFTVVATVLSITRSTKCSCCRHVCVFFKKFKKRPEGTSGDTPADEHLRFDQSDIRGGDGHEETIILMGMEDTRNRADTHLDSLSAGSGNDARDPNSCEAATLDRERNGLFTSEYSHTSDTDEEYNHRVEDSERGTEICFNASGNDPENYVITVPSSGVNNSGHGYDRNDPMRPTEPSLSELLGELPAYSPTPQENVAAAARQSPLAFMTSLLPSRLQRHRRPTSSPTRAAVSGAHPLVYFPSSSVHPDTALPRCGQVHFTIGGRQVLRAPRPLPPSGHHQPLDFSGGTRQQGPDLDSNLGGSPPPPYSEISPPAYSSLFPNSC